VAVRSDAQLRLFEYRYFPYELELAHREVSALAGRAPTRVNGHFVVRGLRPSRAEKLTYFREVVVANGDSIVPLQARLEASDGNGREGAARRQRTRYSAHGIHEYRGKFNPQIVRSTCNLLGLDEGGTIWDPFCGSGTVLLEALHAGMSAIGTDQNPLGVMIANAKLAAVSSTPRVLENVAGRFLEEIEPSIGLEEAERPNRRVVRLFETKLPHVDYLTAWFPPLVLAQLALALAAVEKVVPLRLKSFFRILVSDIVREVSWQDPDDLRIRRRKDARDNYPALSRIREHVVEQVRRIVAARKEIGEPRGWQRAFEADSQDGRMLSGRARQFLSEGVDLVMTSPPYATALPYIDTQRLSLVLLGLASPEHVRRLEFQLLGSREIVNRSRVETESRLVHNLDELPALVAARCRELLESVDAKRDGFRRINMPSLVYRYFVGMQRVIREIARALRRGGRLALLVGPNSTNLGGVHHVIDTPQLLAAIAEATGLRTVETLPLQAYQRYSLHQHNSIREEVLLVSRKK
jgi:RMKL-like, methyltransferase domain